MSSFVPRTVFKVSQDIPRSYFLGHHRAGLEKMKEMISSIDWVIECRDARLPGTSVNPVFEEAMGDKKRLILYTKRDLAGDRKLAMQEKEKKIARYEDKAEVMFSDKNDRLGMLPVLKFLKKQQFPSMNPVTGARVMVVGMPNVGKSSIIAGLKAAATPVGVGWKKKKVARTGAEPGVTRKVGTPITLWSTSNEAVYMQDTPGIFVPYISDPETMVKLAVCGIVKDSIISRITLADYVLFHINRIKPYAYKKYCPPTNDISEFLEQFALKIGALARGGVPDHDRAAGRFLDLYHKGALPRFILDDVDAMKEAKDKGRAEKKNAAHQQAVQKAELEEQDEGIEQEEDTAETKQPERAQNDQRFEPDVMTEMKETEEATLKDNAEKHA